MPPLPVLPGLHVVRALEKVGFEVVGIPIPEATSFGAVGSEYFRPTGSRPSPCADGVTVGRNGEEIPDRAAWCRKSAHRASTGPAAQRDGLHPPDHLVRDPPVCSSAQDVKFC